MDNKKIGILFGFLVIIFLLVLFIVNMSQVYNLEGIVVETTEDYFVVEIDDTKYKFAYLDDNEIYCDYYIEIKYKGKLKENKINKMKSYHLVQKTVSIIDQMESNGIFSAYYTMAQDKLDTMSLEEKIGQLLLVRVPDNNALEMAKKYQFGGYVFFEKDFKDKSSEQVLNEIQSYQDVSKIPMVMATDEEGGTVVRASSNRKLIAQPFLSSQELYKTGGFNLIREDTIKKSKFLSSLGLNVNLAPVVDVVTDENAYMYKRSFGQNTELTSQYADTVIKASKGEDVSYVLKHFPGYGNNGDTHTGIVEDTRSLADIEESDLPPFQAGIDALAEAVLVSHVLVKAIDANNVASLSLNVHELLREDMKFTGVIISDDLDMLSSKDVTVEDYYIKALTAGNDMLLVTDYDTAYHQIQNALDDNEIDVNLIDKAVLRILAWKYYKLLFPIK